MEIKLTPWEKRNLGVDSSIEFYVDGMDAWTDIEEEIKNHNEEYQVIHIDSGNTVALLGAQDIGFQMMEVNIQLGCKLGGFELPPIYQRFRQAISCKVANEQEKSLILETIRTGKIFSTDKIARDSHFGVDISGQRYAYWTQDILGQGAELLCMKYKNNLIGFDVLLKRTDSTAEAFLGGLLPESKASSMGFAIVYLITKFAAEKGYKKIVTGVSSNNIPILKLHEMFGYMVEGMNYCLVKHK